jgi:hypothetical protein
MPQPRRRRHGPQPDRRRALEAARLLPRRLHRVMLAHGFAIPLLVELIRAGLASATTECLVAAREQLKVAYLRITEAGQRAIATETL